jgi:hypothetical protein
MSEITIPDGWSRELLLACVDREIKMRDRAYPRFVEQGRMSHAKMLEEQAGMRAVRAVIAQLPATIPPQAALFPGLVSTRGISK